MEIIRQITRQQQLLEVLKMAECTSIQSKTIFEYSLGQKNSIYDNDDTVVVVGGVVVVVVIVIVVGGVLRVSR